MARDPNITVTERLVRAARRWAAIEHIDLDATDYGDQALRRVGDLEDAVRAYEKHHGMRPLTGRTPSRRSKT